MPTYQQFLQKFDAVGRYIDGDTPLDVVFATQNGLEFPASLHFRDGLCVRAASKGPDSGQQFNWAVPDGSPLNGILLRLKFREDDVRELVVEEGRLIDHLGASVRGIGADTLWIFLSYKTKDKQYAEEIKKKFEELDKNRVQVFISPNMEGAGEDFSHDIRFHLCNSDCLIFLYTDPSLVWIWQHYETGFFHGRFVDSVRPGARELHEDEGYDGRRIFIVHQESQNRPAPLSMIQSIPINPSEQSKPDVKSDLGEFLRRLFFLKSFRLKGPISNSSGNVQEQTILQLQEPFLKAMRAEIRTNALIPKLVLQIPAADAPATPVATANGQAAPEHSVVSESETPPSKTSPAIPPNARLKRAHEDDKDAFRILGIDAPAADSYKSWASFTKVVDDLASGAKGPAGKLWGAAAKFWIRALEAVVDGLRSGFFLPPGLPLIRVSPVAPTMPRFADVYRPAIDSWRTDPDGSVVFTVAFLDLPKELDPLPEGDLGAINLMLRFNRMFRYGILEQGSQDLRQMQMLQQELEAKPEAKDHEEKWSQLCERWSVFLQNLQEAVAKVVAETYCLGYARENVAQAMDTWMGPKKGDILRNNGSDWEFYHKMINAAGGPKDLPTHERLEEFATLFDVVDNLAKQVYVRAAECLALIIEGRPRASGAAAASEPSSTPPMSTSIVGEIVKTRFAEGLSRAQGSPAGNLVPSPWTPEWRCLLFSMHVIGADNAASLSGLVEKALGFDQLIGLHAETANEEAAIERLVEFAFELNAYVPVEESFKKAAEFCLAYVGDAGWKRRPEASPQTLDELINSMRQSSEAAAAYLRTQFSLAS